MTSRTPTASTGAAFQGSPEQADLAARVFELMRRQGMLFAADAPITVALERLVQGLGRAYPGVKADALRTQVEEALAANPDIFVRQDQDGTISFVTSKAGRVPSGMVQDTRHMFRQRLNSAARTVTAEESRDLTESWVASAQARAAEQFTIFQEPAAEAAVAGRWSGPADIAAYVAPAHPVPAPEVPATVPVAPAPVELPSIAEVVRTEEQLPISSAAPAPVAEAPVEAAAPVEAPTPVPVEPAPVRVEPVTPPPTPTPAPVAPVAPPRQMAPTGPARFTLGGATLDVTGDLDDLLAEHGPALEALLGKAMGEDFRYAEFGGDWYPEDHVERFSKGDFRRVKEYLIETQDALSDRTFLSDVLNRRETDPDYERLRFSLNYRLLREKKDFEFVGVPSDRLWTVAGASPVSAPKRKPSELGQDYRYLEDAAAQALEPAVPAGTRRWDHALSYYEYENGLLPYGPEARAILPPPMLPDQRAALLRIEVPVLFQNFPVELRYPTGNRGGYLVGFDAFFGEYLVPGAQFTLEATDQENVLVLRYERTAAQEDSLLQYDERRSRFVFRPTAYYAPLSGDWALTGSRFPKLDNLKRLDESERKKTETIVTRAFELVGEETDGRFYALLTDLLPVVNLERPFSAGALRAVLETGNHPYFEADADAPGAYYYDPTKK